jgi:hypothetical protein
MYSLIYLAKGQLPWDFTHKNNNGELYSFEEIYEIKNNISHLDLCEGLPSKNKI